MVFKTFKSGFFSLERSLKGVNWCRSAVEGVILLGLILGLEFMGRRAGSDIQDLALLVAAIPFLLGILYLHNKRGSRVVARLSEAFQAGVTSLKKVVQMEVGADFRARKDTQLEEQVPYHDLRRFLVAALVFDALVIPFYHSFPDALRLVGENLLYTPYFLMILGFWALLLGVTALDIAILVILFFHYVLKSPFRNPRDHSRGRGLLDRLHPWRMAVLCCVLLLLAGLELLFGLTGWFWLMAGTAVASFPLAFIPRKNENLRLLIKRPSSGTVQSISVSEWNFTFFTVIQGLGLGLFVIATGAGWWGGEIMMDQTSMPCTYILGRLFGAFTTLATVFYLLATLDFIDLKRLHGDPARGAAKRLQYRDGHLPRDLKVEDWILEPTRKLPERDEADLYFDHDAARASSSGVPVFRKNLLTIPPRDRLFYLNRADFIGKRRIFYRGLARLLKICRASSFRGGSGFIFIPHCYFVEGLHRDDRNEHIEEDRIIGPGFQELFGLNVRRFLYDVLRAMDIDIIFFEDGIRFEGLRSVFEMIFELYHNRGVHFRLEEHHFLGLTDTRVVIELIRPDLPRDEHEGFPETHFINLSQARILMVFKDRGGAKDLHPSQSPGMAVPGRR
jgi:hypothetical protein